MERDLWPMVSTTRHLELDLQKVQDMGELLNGVVLQGAPHLGPVPGEGTSAQPHVLLALCFQLGRRYGVSVSWGLLPEFVSLSQTKLAGRLEMG